MRVRLCILLLAVFLGPCNIAFASGPAETFGGSGIYLGAFGGAGASLATHMQQRGAVHLNERLNLPINAQGSSGSSKEVALAGLQLGYAWQPVHLSNSGWALQPAVELEAIHIGKHSPMGEMPVIPRALGTQYVTLPITANLLMANAVFTFQTPYSGRLAPYIGVGGGAAFVSIRNADSYNPMEPGINHFNTDPDSRDTAFAAQFRAGVKSSINRNLSLFAEYRFLTIDATRYRFGETDYPGLHLPTTHWRVDLGRQKYNLFVAGLQYRF